MAVFSFTLLSSLCGTSRLHLGTWFFPELDVLCLQGRTNLAAVALEAKVEQNSSRADTLHVQGHQRDVIYFFCLGFCWQS